MFEKFEYCRAFFQYDYAKCTKTEQHFRKCDILQTAPQTQPVAY